MYIKKFGETLKITQPAAPLLPKSAHNVYTVGVNSLKCDFKVFNYHFFPILDTPLNFALISLISVMVQSCLKRLPYQHKEAHINRRGL